MTETGTRPYRATLADEAATEALGARLARRLGPGDMVCLIGDLGAGKTTVARGVVRAICGPQQEIPSPTYTLVQTYDAGPFEVWHVDLYRLEGPAESAELGLEDAFKEAVVLVEWPERLAGRLPADRIEVRLGLAPGGGRDVEITGVGAWDGRLDDV